MHLAATFYYALDSQQAYLFATGDLIPRDWESGKRKGERERRNLIIIYNVKKASSYACNRGGSEIDPPTPARHARKDGYK